MSRQLIGYRRVSTDKQGRSGLGLEAQDEAIRRHAELTGGEIVGSYTEVESGRKADRPELAKAMAHAKYLGATLVVAKWDRLSRDWAFLGQLMNSGVEFVACDNPHANRLTIQILAAVAEDEARRISERTKAALQAAKARGVRLGKPPGIKPDIDPEAVRRGARAAAEARTEKARQADRHVLPTIASLEAEGLSRRQIADRLNSLGVRRRSGAAWTHTQVARVLGRATA